MHSRSLSPHRQQIECLLWPSRILNSPCSSKPSPLFYNSLLISWVPFHYCTPLCDLEIVEIESNFLQRYDDVKRTFNSEDTQ
jgi:hypothetical protein